MAVASAVFPVTRRFIGLAKETTPGTAVTPTFTMPVTKFTPKDNITYLKDTAWRNAMAELYNVIQGVEIGDVELEGPFFADGVPFHLANILGDYWQAVNGTTGTPTTLNGATTVGATSVVVTSATGLTIGATVAIGTLGTTAEEVRTISNISGNTITLNAALYQAHGNAAAFTPYSAVNTYVHNFSLLNSGLGCGGWSAAQPPTYTYTDYTGVPASTGARVYAYSALSEMSITGNASQLLMWDAKGTSFSSAIAGSTPTASVSADKTYAAWNSTLSIAGSQVNTIEEWKLTLTRKIAPKFTNSGQQSPFAIPRGELSAAITLTVDPAVDESEYLYYLNNTQPTLAVTASNGLTAANLRQVVISMQQAAYETGQIEDSKDVFGYNMTVAAVANTTNAGPSGGYSPCQIAVTNTTVNY